MKQTNLQKIKKAAICAFPHTIPIMTGFLFLGITYGIYVKALGHPAYFPTLTSMTVFAGSAEFVLADLLTGIFHPIQTFALILMINARHLFYGISLLDRYRDTGAKKLYMIFGLCDESFSINCATTVSEDVDKAWFYFFVTLMDHFYWICGCTLGGIFGSFIRFDTTGIDFCMTAMFIVILVEQCMEKKNRIPALIGLGLSLASLLIFGAQAFLIPAMIAIILVLTAARKPLEKEA